MRSIRAKLVLVFVAFAALAVGGMAGAGALIVRDRARAHALSTFAAVREQLRSSLDLRYDVFRATTDLSYTLPVFRNVMNHVDQAELGLGTEEEDLRRLRALNEALADATWDWAQIAGEGFVAVADSRGRLIYRYGLDGSSWVGQVTVLPLPAVRDLYAHPERLYAAAVVRADDPTLLAAKLLDAPEPGAYLLFARILAGDGRPGGAVIQGVRADRLLADVALRDQRTAMALSAPGGAFAGELPGEVRAKALSLTGDEPAAVASGGASWLVQRYPLRGLLPDDPPIGDLLVARNLDEGLRELDQGATLLGIAGLVFFALALGAALVLGARLSRPVIELEGAARAVAGGNLAVQVPVRGRDELGRLATAFNTMTEGLRDRERIKTTFKKYLAPEVVEYLLAHPEAQRLGGERRALTVLFSDLAGFTSISELLEPEQVMALLNGYLARVSKRVVARGGTIDKYIGDSVMAFFGAPLPQEDHPRRACLAALDHLAVLAELRAQAPPGAPTLDARIGINCGDMIVGNVGGEEGQDYTVIGDAVNLASRLEGANKIYGTRILVSGAVRDAVGAEFELRELDLVAVKGRGQAIALFELLGEAGFLAAHPSKKEAVARFAEGLSLFRTRDFGAARRVFEWALEAEGHDGPSKLFAARAAALAAAPPGDDWDGVHRLDAK